MCSSQSIPITPYPAHLTTYPAISYWQEKVPATNRISHTKMGVVEEVEALSDLDLAHMKDDLEARLARFQRAFFEEHGRNPNEEERKPAKPAIKRYKAVCKEISKREQQHAIDKISEESRYVQEDAASIGPMGQIAVDHAQQMGLTSDVVEEAARASVTGAFSSRVERALTRGGGDRVGAAGGATSGGDFGGQAAAVNTNLSASVSSGMSMGSFIPGPGMTELLVNWGQVTPPHPGPTSDFPLHASVTLHPRIQSHTTDIPCLQCCYEIGAYIVGGWMDGWVVCGFVYG